MNPLIVIPARMASTRLPGKPLADIGGKPMIVRVCERAAAANIGPVLVAAAEEEIAEAVMAAGFEAVMTDPALPSGSDRVHAAAEAFDPARLHTVVINLQGDMPTVTEHQLISVLEPLEHDTECDIATLACEISDLRECDDPNVVKAILALSPGQTVGRALYFTRAAAPTGPGPMWHHIGIYAYKRAALGRFVITPPSPLELREKLEQLRALENGMHLSCRVVPEEGPKGVDTPADLEAVRAAHARIEDQA